MIFAYPTESFYALGVDARDEQAIQALIRIKHRAPNKPIALIASGLGQVEKFFYLSKTEVQLAKKYWPGALTMLLKPKRMIAAGALFGLPSFAIRRNSPPDDQREQLRIGVRVPAHAGARHLANDMGSPITATSANIAGRPPTQSSSKLKRDFPDILIVAGRCGHQRLPSTVVEVVNKKIIIHRQGSVHV